MAATMFTLNARVILEAKNPRKASRVLEEFAAGLDDPIENPQIKLYWKDNTKYETTFEIQLAAGPVESFVFKVLKIANQIQKGQWTVQCTLESEPIAISCVFVNETPNQPIRWAHLELLHS